MGKVISISNQKGGVGKTTTSVNLSASLASLGKKILLIDLDPQGNASSGLGVDVAAVEKSVYDALVNGESMKECLIKTDFGPLWVCPATVDLAGAEIELVDMENRERRLKEAIATVRDEFDMILIDCPPSLGLLTLNALTATDTVLMPIQCEYYALEGLSQLTKTIKKVKQALNPDIDIEGVLLTMFDSRTNLSIAVADEVKKFFPNKVYKTVIPRNVRLSEAPSFGQPVNVYDPSSRGAEGYRLLAEEVLSKNEGSRF
ncbi:MAG: ParA family protein [Clostridia bacterium]|nr:ParA family protein [Clostridia bacterium]